MTYFDLIRTKHRDRRVQEKKKGKKKKGQSEKEKGSVQVLLIFKFPPIRI
jgi:hypothetical protein